MTREEIIQGLQFTIDMFLFDPLTGEPITKPRNDMNKTTIDACKGAIELLQQQPYNTSEWCHDCSEYNHDKHCCPRYNKVIRSAVEEMKQPCEDAISRQAVLDVIEREQFKGDAISEIEKLPPVQPKTKTGHWIPVKFRPLTNEEQKEYPDYCYMADYRMPDDGEEILVCTKYGRVEKDECGFDDGYYLDSGYDWQTDIVAWMPLPKPYEPQESENVVVTHKNLCDSCTTPGCIFQSGIVRNHCNFYKAESEG